MATVTTRNPYRTYPEPETVEEIEARFRELQQETKRLGNQWREGYPEERNTRRGFTYRDPRFEQVSQEQLRILRKEEQLLWPERFVRPIA